MKSAAPRPRVICLMQISLDGKIMIDRWPDPDAAEGEYERAHERQRADAWLCGRVVMSYFAQRQRKPRRRPAAPPGAAADARDFVAGGARTYAVAVDASGRIRWRSDEVNGDRLIVLLSRRASRAHRAELRAKGVSYLTTGRGSRLDFREALAKLRRHFGIRRLMLEGGGRINASLLHAGLIDEVCILLTPVVDGDSATTGLFQTDPGRSGLKARDLRLIGVRRLPRGLLELRYRVKNR